MLCLLLLSVSSPSHAKFVKVQQPSDIGKLAAINNEDLCAVAQNTKLYLQNHLDDTFAVHPGKIIDPHISLKQVEQTLAFICATVTDDHLTHRASRLQNSEFLRQHFNFYRWLPDKATANQLADASANQRKQALLRAIPSDQLLLTKYYTKKLQGSAVPTAKYNQALYALPYDEQGLSRAQAMAKRAQLTRFKYTRQQIIHGALLAHHLAKPLVWLTEAGLHDVLLQGTGVLEVNGVLHYYNVHRNNGIAYDYTIGKRQQRRYWYFAEVPSIMGYGKNLASKIAIKAQVTVAGNIKALGVGKLLLLSYPEHGQAMARLAVLADQGGAFDNNLFQLDLLAGSYIGWDDYYQANRQLPDYAKAWILLLKTVNH